VASSARLIDSEITTMNKNLIAVLGAVSIVSFVSSGAFAQNTVQPAPRKAVALCDHCGIVQSVHQEKRKGEGGAAGVVGGALVGGLVGNQFGGGNGKTLATVGGAVAGGFAGNEVQKHVTAKKVWVTKVKMKNGSIRSFEQEAQPGWAAGNAVKVHDNKSLSRL
jgi:uncharacterized protein YcfJ